MVTLGGALEKCAGSQQAFLHCELGSFAVLDKRLDEISAGHHEGLFEVMSIQPYLLPPTGGVGQLGMLATLKRFSFVEADVKTRKIKPKVLLQEELSLFEGEENVSELPAESQRCLDKTSAAMELPEVYNETALETVSEVSTLSVVVNTMTESESATETDSAAADRAEIIAVFGEDFRLSETIVLDATESRDVLRQKRDCLKKIGYRFDAERQIWQRPMMS